MHLTINTKKTNFFIAVVLVLLQTGIESLLAYFFRQHFSAAELAAPVFRVTRLLLSATIAYAIFAGALYYMSGKQTRFPKFSTALSHLGIGLALALLTITICLLLSPALYYHASHFQPQALWQISIIFGFFIFAATIEEIMFRCVIQRFLCLFLPVSIATLLQVSLFVWFHDPGFPETQAQWVRIAGWGCFGFFATLLTKRSPYLILPIAYHAGENFFRSMLNLDSRIKLGMQVDGIWNLGASFHGEYVFIIVTIYSAIFLYKYGWSEQGKADSSKPIAT
jgi:membrane protease YdiL (CAAX protease family)